jgi:hypothetical protein
VDEKATQLHAIASLKVLLDATKPQNGAATSSAANHVTVAQRLEHEKNQETQLAGMQEQPNGVASGLEDAAAVDTVSTLKLQICPEQQDAVLDFVGSLQTHKSFFERFIFSSSPIVLRKFFCETCFLRPLVYYHSCFSIYVSVYDSKMGG